ncbi:hypothetical protein Z945_709 [Sulfitobacter noctilucae]|uniref:hypothetical protein n=1 Tax=Sulfitobacter noctilucae TaxID=1342302 RepID=UPI000469AC70|nr:hypothetical protein [Sulfitobacter noctilucae]KIN65662.1 hypothetical protein Z945_709 [Sulfitobacter noctilucae]
MFNSLTNGQLEALIEQFLLPMFIIQRRRAGTDFEMVGMNSALERLARQPRQAIMGQSVSDMAISGVNNDAGFHFLQCATSRKPVRFTYAFEHDDHKDRWDMILQYGQSPEGYDRIISTANQLTPDTSALQDKVAFEDVSYFSSIADLQLENLSNAFSNVTQGASMTVMEEERMMRLHAVCRTIQRSVSDIKDIVRRAQARHCEQQQHPHFPSMNPRMDRAGCMDTVRALSDAWVER